METSGTDCERKRTFILCVSGTRAARVRDEQMNVAPGRLFLLFPTMFLGAAGVLNVEISEKCALDLKQGEIIILMTYRSSVVLAGLRHAVYNRDSYFYSRHDINAYSAMAIIIFLNFVV